MVLRTKDVDEIKKIIAIRKKNEPIEAKMCQLKKQRDEAALDAVKRIEEEYNGLIEEERSKMISYTGNFSGSSNHDIILKINLMPNRYSDSSGRTLLHYLGSGKEEMLFYAVSDVLDVINIPGVYYDENCRAIIRVVEDFVLEYEETSCISLSDIERPLEEYVRKYFHELEDKKSRSRKKE